MKPKIIAIVGPTASGKSDLAVSIAKKFNAEVISADSRQVYTGLNIGTGKITKKEMQGVPHHLLDVVDPKKVFNVSDFKRLSDQKIKEIIERGKVPILCGGTGFYIDAVVDNVLLPEVPPNAKLRDKLQKYSCEKLFTILLKLDKNRAKGIDSQNKVRLIRAIEIAKVLGKVPKIKSKPIYDTLFIGTLIDEKTLKERIQTRLLKRIKSGMIREVKALHKKGLSWKRMEALGLEYRYLALYLQNKMTKAEMLERLRFEIEHYSKRQMKWFKRNDRIHWLKPSDIKKIQKLTNNFLK